VAKMIKPKPALLIAQLQMMSAALTKYAEQYVPVSPSKADIEACAAELMNALQVQVQTAGVAEKATKDLYATRDKAIDLLRRMRDAVYAHFGKSDPRIVEFGLDTLKNRRNRNGNDSATPPAEG